MSFAGETKKELARLRLRKDAAMRALLVGVTHTAGTLCLGKIMGLEYSTETYEVGQLVASLAPRLYNVDAVLALRKAAHRRAAITEVRVSGEGIAEMLADFGLLIRQAQGVRLSDDLPSVVYESENTKKKFLRGVFLGAGSISNPKRAYHLEIVCNRETLAERILVLMRAFSCLAKTVRRKDRTVVYLKEGDGIAAFLALIGAPVATLAFEDARAERELRNYINRKSNCETANIGKTVYAAGDQLDAIEKIIAMRGLSKLTPVMRKTAEMRLNNPESSLAELAQLAGIGKSGMNHRLQRLVQLAERL
ncbi:MAG: DNA-binding protein WhiA [Clostridiales bacterium]|jgi:DNA-binding protein WhiA|nr:DNA-binding protein WhiA [Clostridiales bacterium]